MISWPYLVVEKFERCCDHVHIWLPNLHFKEFSTFPSWFIQLKKHFRLHWLHVNKSERVLHVLNAKSVLFPSLRIILLTQCSAVLETINTPKANISHDDIYQFCQGRFDFNAVSNRSNIFRFNPRKPFAARKQWLCSVVSVVNQTTYPCCGLLELENNHAHCRDDF